MRVIKRILSIFFLFVLALYLSPNTAALAEAGAYPELSANSAVLMDAQTGQVLFEKNMHKKKYPASITKVMTGMLALEKGSLDDILIMSPEAVFSIGRNTSHVALDVEEELTLEQALYAISINSANDAANGIAEHISGSLEGFARLMNKKAVEAGAMQTNFVNAHGLPDADHYTTAYDMAKLMKEAIKTPGFAEIFSATRYEIPPTNKTETRYLNSRNALLREEYQHQVIAGKSGWTSQANHTLITAAKRGTRELIAVVMDNQNRNDNYEDTVKLLDYGFDDFLDISFAAADLKTKIAELFFNDMENPSIKIDQNMDRLLHKSLSREDIKTSCEVLGGSSETLKVKLLLSLKRPTGYMYSNLGEVFLEVETGRKDVQGSEAGLKNTTNYFLAVSGLIGLGMILVFRRKRNSRKGKVSLYRSYRL